MQPAAVESSGLVRRVPWFGRRLAAGRLVVRLPEMLVAGSPERS